MKMLTYALGRPVGYTDHELVDSLVAALQQNDYRIQSLIHGDRGERTVSHEVTTSSEALRSDEISMNIRRAVRCRAGRSSKGPASRWRCPGWMR